MTRTGVLRDLPVPSNTPMHQSRVPYDYSMSDVTPKHSQPIMRTAAARAPLSQAHHDSLDELARALQGKHTEPAVSSSSSSSSSSRYAYGRGQAAPLKMPRDDRAGKSSSPVHYQAGYGAAAAGHKQAVYRGHEQDSLQHLVHLSDHHRSDTPPHKRLQLLNRRIKERKTPQRPSHSPEVRGYDDFASADALHPSHAGNGDRIRGLSHVASTGQLPHSKSIPASDRRPMSYSGRPPRNSLVLLKSRMKRHQPMFTRPSHATPSAPGRRLGDRRRERGDKFSAAGSSMMTINTRVRSSSGPASGRRLSRGRGTRTVQTSAATHSAFGSDQSSSAVDDMPLSRVHTDSQSNALGGAGAGVPPGVPESVDESAMQLEACTRCGRTFKPKALAIHRKSCKGKVEKKARRPVTQLKRKGNKPNATGKLKNRPAKKQANKDKGGAWRNKSSALRDAMRAARMTKKALESGVLLSALPPPPTSSVPDDRVPCPHCGRKFGQEQAERHIPRCKDIRARPTMLKRGQGKGAGAHGRVSHQQGASSKQTRRTGRTPKPRGKAKHAGRGPTGQQHKAVGGSRGRRKAHNAKKRRPTK